MLPPELRSVSLAMLLRRSSASLVELSVELPGVEGDFFFSTGTRLAFSSAFPQNGQAPFPVVPLTCTKQSVQMCCLQQLTVFRIPKSCQKRSVNPLRVSRGGSAWNMQKAIILTRKQMGHSKLRVLLVLSPYFGANLCSEINLKTFASSHTAPICEGLWF